MDAERLLNFMPQFDIASFYPQITFFAGTFLMFYVFLEKHALPKLGQNLKLNRKLSDVYHMCVGKGNGGVSQLAYVYGPTRTLSHAIYAEVICLGWIRILTMTLVHTFVSSLAALRKAPAVSSPKFSALYLSALGDLLSTVHQRWNEHKS